MLEIVAGTVLSAIVAVVIFVKFFYRDPERATDTDPNIIYAPADGWIRSIKEVKNGETPTVRKNGEKIRLEEITQLHVLDDDQDGYLISIYMTPFDVHVNRSPVVGEVTDTRYISGKRRPLVGKKYPTINERNTVVIESEAGFHVGVVQIASHFARRVVCYIEEGQKLLAGERIGMIKLSSQVDIIIPKIPELELLVKKRSRVKAGKTPIAVVNNYNDS